MSRFSPIASTLLAVGLFATAPAMAQLKAFRASYTASYNAMDANASMSLASAGSGRWNYTLTMQNPLVKLNRSAVVEESGDTLRPISNQESINMLVQKRQKNGSYDWGSMQARWSGRVNPDRMGPIRLQAGDVDAMTMNLAVVRDALAGRPMRYRLVENGKAKPMTFTRVGNETISVAGKPMQAVKISNSDGDTRMTLWVVQGIPVPVRIQQRENDGDNIELRLNALN